MDRHAPDTAKNEAGSQGIVEMGFPRLFRVSACPRTGCSIPAGNRRASQTNFFCSSISASEGRSRWRGSDAVHARSEYPVLLIPIRMVFDPCRPYQNLLRTNDLLFDPVIITTIGQIKWGAGGEDYALVARFDLGSRRAMLSTQNCPGVKLNEKTLVPLFDSGSAVRRRA